MKKSECQNCDWQGDDLEMKNVFPNIPGLAERITPGEEMPSGECPKCGALAHYVASPVKKVEKVYVRIATLLNAVSNCVAKNNLEWKINHGDALKKIMQSAPSGSGIDCGTEFSIDDNLRDPAKLIFTASFHHMNEGGFYSGWTEHEIIVTPNLQFGFDLKITGRDKNQIKEYLHEIYSAWLDSEISE